MPINDAFLPDAIILQIFRHLTYANLCKASQVCTLWRRISRDFSLRKVIDVRGTPLTPETIEEFVKHHCSEELIDLKLRLVGQSGIHDDDDDDDDDDILVSDIQLPYTNITPHCLELLEEHAPNLEYLTLENSMQIENREERVVFIANLPKSIKHLSLANGGFVYEHDPDLNSNGNCSNVICLDLRDCKFGKDDYIRFWADAPQLKSLYLEDAFFYNSYVQVHIFGPVLPQLKILDLESTWISEEQTDLVFQNCAALEELYIGNNNDATNQMLHRIRSGQLPVLHTLCVINTSVTEDMEHFVKLKLKNLKHFNCRKQETPCHHYLNHKCPI